MGAGRRGSALLLIALLLVTDLLFPHHLLHFFVQTAVSRCAVNPAQTANHGTGRRHPL